MLRASLKLTNKRAVFNAISRAAPKLIRQKLTTIASSLEAEVRSGLYGLLIRDSYVSQLLYGELSHELGIPRGALEDVLMIYCKEVRVEVRGTRNPALVITIPPSTFLLTLEQSYYFGKDGKSYEWLSKIFDPTFNAVTGYWYRTSVDGKSLDMYSRSGKGLMLPAKSKTWTRSDPVEDRDFVNNVLNGEAFRLFLLSIFKKYFQ